MTPSYKIVEFPKSRLGTFDLGIIARKKHSVAALIEIDVTRGREEVRHLRREGKKVSFLSWFIKMIAIAMQAHPDTNAYRYSKNKNVNFNDIDISIIIEKRLENKLVPLPVIIRAINRKSAEEIYQEIETAKNSVVIDSTGYVLSKGSKNRYLSLFYSLPQWLRIRVMNRIFRNPFKTKEMMGTVLLTSLGIAGRVSGWIFPKSYHPLSFAVGSIKKKPWIVNDEIAKREIMNLTIIVDHDVIDGAPAARFVSGLVNLIES